MGAIETGADLLTVSKERERESLQFVAFSDEKKCGIEEGTKCGETTFNFNWLCFSAPFLFAGTRNFFFAVTQN